MNSLQNVMDTSIGQTPETVAAPVIPPAPSMAFSIGVDSMDGLELTPQQLRKKERFLRQRQQKMIEEKEKKAAEVKKAEELKQQRLAEGTSPTVIPNLTPAKKSREDLTIATTTNREPTPKRAGREERGRDPHTTPSTENALYHETLAKR